MLLTNFFVPQCLGWLWRHFPDRHEHKPSTIHKLSVVLPVFNEEKLIARRLQNVLEALKETDCPHEVLIGSDGSEDKTVNVAMKFIEEHGLLERWKVFEFPNEGKGRTINKLVHHSTGELVISTDCDVSMDSHAIDGILKAFEADDQLGCVSCVPEFSHDSHNTQSFYWDIEMKIRETESQMGFLIVVTGWLYAFRRSLYKDIPTGAMADDLWVPLSILAQEYRCSHLSEIKAFSEETDERTEIKRRERVISGGADIVKRLLGQLLREPELLAIVFLHKINRWLVPVWGVLFLISSICLMPPLIIVYVIGLVIAGVYFGPQRLMFIFQSLYAPVLSFLHMRRKKDLSKWEKTRI